MTPLPATLALDQFYLEARSKLLDLAAIFDRIDRGENPESAAADTRLHRLRAALTILQDDKTNRAESVQKLFSLEYDPSWVKPKPR